MGKCIPLRKKCDGVIDCEDGHDEDVCEKNLFEEWGRCSQICHFIQSNSTGNHVDCKCEVPYNKYNQSDQSCIPEGNTAVLMISDEDKIYEQKVIDVFLNDIKRNVSEGAAKIISLDVDTSSTDTDDWKLFVLKHDAGNLGKSIVMKLFKERDEKKDSEKPPRNTRDTTLAEKEEILISGLNYPRGLAVDWIGKMLYWTESSPAKIEMCRYDGTTCTRQKTVVHTDLSQPFSIAVDTNVWRLFWTDRGFPSKIESSNLDGSNGTVVVQNFLIWPNGLAVDYPNQRIYWADTKSHVVETVNYNGTERHIVKKFNASDPPYQVEVFEDDLYVTTYKEQLVNKFPKFYKDGNTVTALTGKMMHISGVVIVQESKHMVKDLNVTNACSTSPCQKTQMCINIPSGPVGKKFSCLCSDGAQYNAENKSCDFIKCQPGYCRNKGNCTTTKSWEFKCSCPMGFGGKRCEIDACLNYCGAGGTCVVGSDNPTSPTCHFPVGFTGKRCETNICAGYCLNGGSCSSLVGSPSCRCLMWYIGKRCEKFLDNVQCEGY